MISKSLSRITVFILAFVLESAVFAQSALDACKAQFIGGTINNAPTLYTSAPDVPYGSNKQLCYYDKQESFFALEYWPEEYAPRWVAYKLSPDNYGPQGCHTFKRKIAGCYFNKATWSEFLSCTKGTDPFHADERLPEPKLGKNAFASTGHDRGHMAPRMAFSWDVCGTYQTFSMANMSPQKASLNEHIWADLEQQVLTWGIDDGPIYVVTGTTFRTFPAKKFAVYSDRVLNDQQVYTRNSEMLTITEKLHENYVNTASGDILHPLRDANPAHENNQVEHMRMPTGYFKVIYRPATGNEPAHAIGFLLPHSFENLRLAANSYSNLKPSEAFWLFVARIDLIEETSGVHFSGIPQAMKSQWGDVWFFAHDKSRSDLRANSCGRGTPKGVILNSTLQERIQACTDKFH